MAIPEKALYARLVAHTGLDALIDGRVSAPIRMEGEDAPSVSFQRVPGTKYHTMGTEGGTLTKGRFLFSAWADTYEGANDVAEQVKAALHNWSGTAGGVAVQWIILEDWQDDYEPETKIFRKFAEGDVIFDDV